eukprot:TRINITY_DN91447_c0_g1_i1.p1 TRINITY_DN91447_c0_g1~~TRINITY_DN91447_c0_g1_i1.p1  ORF type:complete len:518 (-),score=146.93 TRINITY_DN91447_c0_g1_i1:49-1494(-)
MTEVTSPEPSPFEARKDFKEGLTPTSPAAFAWTPSDLEATFSTQFSEHDFERRIEEALDRKLPLFQESLEHLIADRASQLVEQRLRGCETKVQEILDQKLPKMQAEFEERFGSLSNSHNAALHEQIAKAESAIIAAVGKEILMVQEKVREATSRATVFDNFRVETQFRLQRFDARISEEKTEFNDYVDDRVKKLQQASLKKLEESSAEHRAATIDLVKETENNFNALRSKMDEQLKTVLGEQAEQTKAVREKLDHRMREFEESMDEKHEAMQEETDRMFEEMQLGLRKLEGAHDDLHQSIVLKEHHSTLEENLMQKLERCHAEIDSQTSSWHRQAEEIRYSIEECNAVLVLRAAEAVEGEERLRQTAKAEAEEALRAATELVAEEKEDRVASITAMRKDVKLVKDRLNEFAEAGANRMEDLIREVDLKRSKSPRRGLVSSPTSPHLSPTATGRPITDIARRRKNGTQPCQWQDLRSPISPR